MRLLAFLLLLAVLSACAPTTPVVSSATPLTPTITPTVTVTPTPSLTPSPSPSPTRTDTPIPTPTATRTLAPLDPFDPAGCQRPPSEAGEVVEVNGWLLNRRTLTMLENAQKMYGGKIELTGAAVTQGSYHDNGSLSFGTHLGGGAVDLSIFLPGTWQVDYANLPRLVRALRASGFAAWVRVIDEVYPGSGYHIHAIAVGDPELSEAAEAQLTGIYGYFRGFDGLPRENGVPVADREGGPIVCAWMRALGYSDLREAPDTPWPRPDWQAALEQTGQDYLDTPADILAHNLYTTTAGLDRALAWDLWRAAGLLPALPNPAHDLRAFLQFPVDPKTFWDVFPPETYAHKRFEISPAKFDFSTDPLLPGDLVALTGAGQAVLTVVTQVDETGRAFAPVAQKDADGWRIEVAMLYDPGNADAGWLRGWEGDPAFDRLRINGIAALPGTTFAYLVQPGDTLADLAARFRSGEEAIRRANPKIDPARLDPGQRMTIESND